MKKICLMLCGIFVFLQLGQAQIITLASENFDGVVTFTSRNSLSASWSVNTVYSVSAPNSYLGTIPTSSGDTIFLTTPVYDLSNYENVRLSFDHICKVASSDIACIQYRLDQMGPMGAWKEIPTAAYEGTGKFYDGKFSSTSYVEWDSTNILAQPAPSWWKSEAFNISNQVGYERAQFRFVIIKGNATGTQFAYGWLLDNFKLEVSTHIVAPPTVEILPSSVTGRQTYNGPFPIFVKLESNTPAAMLIPNLQLKLTYEGNVTYDSLPLTLVSGSTYTANIGPYLVGTRVDFKVIGSDAYGNTSSDSSFVVVGREGKHFYWTDTTITTTTSYLPYNDNYTYSWSRVLYLASELRSGTITHLAWKCNTANVLTDSLYVWMKNTSQTTINNATGTGSYSDPSKSGATLVWSGPITTIKGWVDLYLDNPFTLLKDSNLVIYTAVTKNATKITTNWYCRTISNRARYGRGNNSLTDYNTTTTSVPLIRLSFDLDSNDVLLNNIGPDYVMGGVTPVQAMIQNLGLKNLTSAIISWSVNGVQQPDYNWTGNLAEGYKDTVTIGSYMPTARAYDTIKVWVHTPNGVANDTSRLSKILFGCNGANPIAGVFTVGLGQGNDFDSVATALSFFNSCGVSGDIELALTDSVIEQKWDFTNIGAAWGNNRLIIRSATNNADNTILRVNTYNANTYGVTFNNSSNITLKHLTIDASNKNYQYTRTYTTTGPIIFTGSASNINISHCKLLSRDTTNSNYRVITKNSNTGVLRNVRFDHNTISNGYYGFYLYAGLSGDTGVVYIDSNVITGSYGQAIFLNWADPYIKGNECYPRTAGTNAPWYGIHCVYGQAGEVCNNKIKGNMSGRTEGINLGAMGIANTPVLVANNEIMAYSTTSDNGMSTNTGECHIDFINNSVLCMGTGAMRGIQVHNDANSQFTIRNNNVVMYYTSAYPIYINGTISRVDMANNNQWSQGTYWGYVGANKTTEDAWKSSVPTEERPTRILPTWKDTTNSLELRDLNSFAGLECPRRASVRRDKNDLVRLLSTYRGAYSKPITNLDAAITEIQGWSADSFGGAQSDIKVTLYNQGVTPVSTINMTWAFNGVQQNYNWAGNLPVDSSVTVTLGTITYVAGMDNSFVAWLNTVNGGRDDDQSNDTISSGNTYICPGIYKDTVYVGPSRTFTTAMAALDRIDYCGAQGNITIAYDDGTYIEDIALPHTLKGMTAQDTLFFISVSGTRANVKILRSDDATTTYLGIGTVYIGMDNVVFKNLTIMANRGDGGTTYNTSTAVSFSKACNNIEFDNCILAGLQLSAIIEDSVRFDVIYSNFAVSNLRVHDCLLSGGSHSVFMTSAAKGDNISFVNNRIVNYDIYGLRFNGASHINIEGNRFVQRNSSTISPLASTAIYIKDGTGRIIANKTNSAKGSAAIKLISFNAANAARENNGLVANNEILMSDGQGIYVSNVSYVDIINNSVLKIGRSASYGLFFDMVMLPNMVNVLNNNIVLKSSANDYPLYVLASSAMNSNYNNYYSTSGHIAFMDSVDVDSLGALKAITQTDNRTVSVSPVFLDENTSAKLLDYTDLSCPTQASVPTDIEGVNRGTLTAKGAYHIETPNTDVALMAITAPVATGAISGVNTPVKVRIYNAGATNITSLTLNWMIDGVLQPPFAWTGNLAPQRSSADITIGSFVPTSGFINLTVIADSANGLAVDDRPSNDTATIRIYSCVPTMRGTYLVDAVDPNADFLNLGEAILALTECGIDSTVVIELKNSNESAVSITKPILGASDTNRVLITSYSGNAADVLISGENYVGDVAHLTFSKLSFTTNRAYMCINFSSDVEDIEVSDCILTNTQSKDANMAGGNGCICSPATITLSNVRIYRNELHGAYQGLYLNGKNSTIEVKGNTFYGANRSNIETDSATIIIDSNTIIGIEGAVSTINHFSIIASHGQANITNNIITMPKKKAAAAIVGMYLDSTEFVVSNNQIIANSEVAAPFYGIYTQTIRNANISHNKINVKGAYTEIHGVCPSVANSSKSFFIENNEVSADSCPRLEKYFGVHSIGVGSFIYLGATAQYHINGNKLWMSDMATTDAYGLYLYPSNPTNTIPEIVNNEIYVKSNGANCRAITCSVSAAKNVNISHNSIKTYNRTGTGYGIYLLSGTTGIVRNNNVETEGEAYPIYVAQSDATFGPNADLDIDYNNIYGTVHVGYAGGAARDLVSDWQSVVTSDKHSVSIKPVYADSTLSLKVLDTNDFYCERISSVPVDITGQPRYGRTLMGAYTAACANIDLTLSDVFNLNKDSVHVGDNVVPELEIHNVGGVPITSARIDWTYNGVQQQPFSWTGNLSSFDKDTVVAPAAITIAGGYINQEFVFWISDVNNGGKDSVVSNDTLILKYFLCDSALNGSYTVDANNGDFASIDDAMSRIRQCGMRGNVNLVLAPGVYTDNFVLTTVLPGQDTCMLTFTKDYNNPQPVIFRPTSGVAITLKDQKNLAFDSLHINVQATGATSGIAFTGACTTIVVSNCIFEGKSSDGTVANSGIYKASNSTVARDIVVRNSYFKGGCAGIYMYIGRGTSTNYYGTMTVDSNLFEGQYNYGAWFYYGDMTFDNNIVKTDATANTTWCGARFYYVNPQVRNNRIISIAKTLASGYGMYSYYVNTHLTTGDVNYVNNEVILKGTSTPYGMYFSYSKQVNVMFNSIYMNTTSSARGLYSYNKQGLFTCTDNNIVMTLNSTSAYPIYVDNTTNWFSDYNNYYTQGTNKAYIGANKTSLSAIQTTTHQDASSVIMMPSFVDSVNVPVRSMALVDANGLTCLRDPQYPNDINGVQRDYITAMGCYSAPTSNNVDFEMVKIIAPSHSDNLCSPDYTSAKVAVKSQSGIIVNFATMPLKLTVQMSGMDTCTKDTIISTGSILPYETDTFEITQMLPVGIAGDYYITAFLTCAADTTYSNDTLRAVYRTTRTALPYDEDFSTLTPLADMTIDTLQGVDAWTIEIGGNIGYIDPVYGTGKIGFGGPLGSMSRLSTAPIELYKANQPTFEFWYAHDTSNATFNDQTDVKISFDGGNTFRLLLNLKRYDATITVPTWKKYSIDLSPYTDSTCVVISFEGLSYGGGKQYIDRIAINAVSNIALTNVVTPNIDACTQANGTLGIELSNATSQAINFANTPTSVIVEVSGSITATYTYPLNSGILAGLEVDTLVVSNSFNFAQGSYNIKAYISPTIDNILVDDTVYRTLVINPSLTVVAKKATTSSSCVIVGAKIAQDVDINNVGNIDMEDLVLLLEVSNSSGSVVETMRDTISGVLRAGASISYTFKNDYTVPNDEQYNVSVTVYPMCNATKTFQSVINECIDLNDLAVDGILSPVNDGTCYKVGDRFSVKVKVSNKNPIDDANNVVVHAEIVDKNGSLLADWTETINTIYADDAEELEFAPFTVPSVASFTVNAYLVGNIDINPHNDTAAPVTKCTELGIGNVNANSISMSQNIPNPANGKTSVNYTIPEDGKVMFNIMTVTGQILYTEEVNAMSGDNRIEFNTESMASGIYFYTMTYKGQRIVRKMTIEK
ncbi:MAG: T9SS type A sorting domain-containing protein [Bacteroidales bacterium]|nr:T9SS type A sorting domain-containing protein [Bacteroidales bacterium]